MNESATPTIEVEPAASVLERELEFAGERREVRKLAGAIPATIHHPLSGTPRGSVLLLPGWSGPRSGPADILAFLATRLAQRGWLAARVDLPGRGDASAEGDVDLDAMIATAADAAQALTQEEKSPALLGICSGGNVALGAAPLSSSERNRQVIAISTFPFQPARTQTFERRRRWQNFKLYARKALSPRTWVRLIRGDVNVARVRKNVSSSEKPAQGRNLKDSARDIEAELKQWPGTALFVWGGGDEEGVPARAHFETLHANGMGAKKSVHFHTVAGANHNFYGRGWREELCTEIVRYLEASAVK